MIFSRIVLVLILIVGLSCIALPGAGAANPVVSLSPSSGPIGTKVTVSVCNMTPGFTVLVGNITFNGDAWNTQDIKVDSSGCMCATSLTVPVAPIGPNGVVVTDGNITATGIFTITQPNITVSPTSGYKGQTIAVTGSGWLTHSFVTLTFEGNRIGTVKPDSAGSFTTEFVVPLTAKQSNVSGAGDTLGNVRPAATFTLKPPGMTLNPLSGYSGTLVQVTGFGFEPYSGVENLRISSTAIPAPGLITNHMGIFTTTFEAPSLPGGGYIVTATVNGITIDACFTIIEGDVWGEVGDEYATPIETALSSISDYLIRVWCYHKGEWRMYDPDDPLGSNLTGLVNGRAYWVKVSNACGLIYRNLQEGWNNIGW